MDYRVMTAPCGLDCFNCPMYHAFLDEGMREKIAGHMHIPKEKAACRGCRNEKGIIGFMGMKDPCPVYQCTKDKGLAFCFECKDFPCDHLHPYADKAKVLPHNTKVFNLCLIKRMGIDAWAREKAEEVKKRYFKDSFRL
ncbi:MAG: DUF3795 domain-containing protein [Thermodesulfobacteriota bacterium]|nr:DUF3795 domain-containing protein [Thermodesulfobacteriota bacterium]